MSHNIIIFATRKITFKKKNGKRSGEIQEIEFNALQTPTRITRAIQGASNPIAEYWQWVINDCDNPEHAEEFLEWVRQSDDAGFQIKFESN